MKKSCLFLMAVMALTSITSCCNDSEDFQKPSDEIRLTSEIAPTRVVSPDYQSTRIVEGQQVGVTITGAKSGHRNVAWYVGEGGVLSNTGEPVYWAKGDVTITAYHPYNQTWSGTSHRFTVSTDQSSEKNYRNSDLLWATATSSVTDGAVPLVFSHRLAKINVTLRSEDIEELSGATISICGTGTATTFNPEDGTLSGAASNVAEIKAAVTTATAYTASAIVVPQTVASGTKFIKVELDGRNFYYTLSASKELKAGYSHNYTLTVSEEKKCIYLGHEDITDWKDDNNSGYAQEEVITVPNNELWYTTSDERAVTLCNRNNKYGNEATDNVYENGKGVITFSGGDLMSIGDAAFNGCGTLTSVMLPDCITHIESSAFYSCTALTSINIPNNVTIIDAAFINCSALTKISIPGKVTGIADCAFLNCTSLKEVHVKAVNPPTIYNDTFENCSGDLTVYVPAASIDAYRAADNWKELNLVGE
ncbi:MAG: fimbrillin family protein [Bacteroidaceae bacterium]|nr:fimbrillin family protein [Bacteroidaceae bacterium]